MSSFHLFPRASTRVCAIPGVSSTSAESIAPKRVPCPCVIPRSIHAATALRFVLGSPAYGEPKRSGVQSQTTLINYPVNAFCQGAHPHICTNTGACETEVRAVAGIPPPHASHQLRGSNVTVRSLERSRRFFTTARNSSGVIDCTSAANSSAVRPLRRMCLTHTLSASWPITW